MPVLHDIPRLHLEFNPTITLGKILNFGRVNKIEYENAIELQSLIVSILLFFYFLGNQTEEVQGQKITI